jgi:coenzyme PQQ synthesis protein D (PqqD)
MNNSQVPVARKQGLVVQEMPEEVLIYDLDTNKAHCLNKTAAFVWKSCDGNKSVADITKSFENDFGSSVDEDLVWLAIEQLGDKNLLNESLPTGFKGQSRREVIKKIGFAAVIALPVVASLAAPTSALASASCACVVPADCAAQAGCPSTVNCNAGGVCAP